MYILYCTHVFAEEIARVGWSSDGSDLDRKDSIKQRVWSRIFIDIEKNC